MTFPKTFALGLLGSAMALAGMTASAQTNIEKMKQMKVATTDLNIPLVPQEGKNADAIRENLKRVKLPPGFKIDLYAVVPDARHMAVAPSTNMLFVGTRKTTVWAVTNRNSGDRATEVKSFAPSLKFSNPNGVCWTKDGFLIVAEHNRVLTFPAAEFFYEGPDVAVGEVVPQGKLVPTDEESYNHGARTCRVGPDGKLYITLGQPFNVPPAEKIDMYRQLGIGGIVRMDLDGSKREVYAIGVRNSVGQDFNPKDGTLWFTDNQTDGMGDEIPPGELNRATKAGQDFGYPYWCGHTKVAGTAAAPDLKNLPEPKNAVFPQVEYPAHQAQLGMTFYSGKMFPAKYQGGIFVASHGSWNRTKPTGALIDFTSLKADGTADKTEVFASGWIDEATGLYRGRPVDVAVMKDGSLLVSDDFAGALYRITYVGE
jgi:glucose/arabinose dehydrogenase